MKIKEIQQKISKLHYTIQFKDNTDLKEAIKILKSLIYHSYQYQIIETGLVFTKINQYEDVKQLLRNKGITFLEKTANKSKFATKEETINKALNLGKGYNIIEKGEYIGTDKVHQCERNSLKHKKEYEIYKGLIIFYDPSYKIYTWQNHYFNVKDNKVYEFTNLELNRIGNDWSDYVYVGIKIPEEYTKNLNTLISYSKKEQKNIALDFDGVIHGYSEGWKDGTIYDKPVEGVEEALKELIEDGWKIIVYTTREDKKDVEEYISNRISPVDNKKKYDIEVTNEKPLAEMYIDDRAITFKGDWKQTLEDIKKFKPYLDKKSFKVIASKQVGTLYHFTTFGNLLRILYENKLNSPVSLTRNKNFISKVIPQEVRIDLDGDKLSNNYKIKPYSWKGDLSWQKNISEEGKNKLKNFEDQNEEVINNDIQFVKSYIKNIEVKEIDLWDYLDEDRIKELDIISLKLNKPIDELSYNDIEQYLKSFGGLIKLSKLQPFQTRTGIPFYDNMLENKEYYEKNKNRKFKIEQLTPDQYISECARIQGISIKEEYDMIIDENLNDLKNKIQQGIQLNIPILDYAENSQEGRHRALAAKQLGIERIPVLIVEKVKDEKKYSYKLELEPGYDISNKEILKPYYNDVTQALHSVQSIYKDEEYKFHILKLNGKKIKDVIMLDKVAGKQVGTLYHFTSLLGLDKILYSNILNGMQNYISFTRNPNLLNYEKRRGFGAGKDSSEVRIAIDGNKLSNNYKIQPYNYFNPDNRRFTVEKGEEINKYHLPYLNENEERIKGKINNIKNYIIKIDITTEFEEKSAEIIEIKKLLEENNIPYSFKKLSSKQVGTLYHNTSVKNAMNILDSNVLLPKTGYISFTRNKNFFGVWRESINDEVKIVIDGDKLSNNYKIEPYRFFYRQDKNPENDESEERVKDDIINIRDYIIKIIIIPVKSKIQDVYKLYVKCKEYNIPVITQNKTSKTFKPIITCTRYPDYPSYVFEVKNPENNKKIAELITEQYGEDEKKHSIFNIEVEEKYRRQNIATRMFNYAKQFLLKKGIELVHSKFLSEEGRQWREKVGKKEDNHLTEKQKSKFTKLLDKAFNGKVKIVKNSILTITSKGKIYFDFDKLTIDGKIYENGNLYNKIIQKTNPKLWYSIINLSKETKLWNKYNGEDSEKADKIFSSLLNEYGNTNEEIRDEDFTNRLKEILNLYANEIKKVFNFNKYDNLSSEDILTKTLGDLLDGIPVSSEGKINEIKEYYKEIFQNIDGFQDVRFEEDFMSLEDKTNYYKKLFGETISRLLRNYTPVAFDDYINFSEYLKKKIPLVSNMPYIIKEHGTYIEKQFLKERENEEKNEQKNTIKDLNDLMKESGYEFNSTPTGSEILKFRVYYPEDGQNGRDVICTYNDPNSRANNYYVSFIVKQDAKETLPASQLTQENLSESWKKYLKENGRENEDGTYNLKGLKNKREDPFSTSVLSIQINKNNPTNLKVISRYNHTIQEGNTNPDAVYNLDLDKIIEGLNDSLYNYYGIENKNKIKEELPDNVVKDNKERYFNYYKEENGVYYGGEFYINHGESTILDSNEERLIEGWSLNNKGNVKKIGSEFDDFVFKNIKKVIFKKKGKIELLTENGKIIFNTQNGKIISIDDINENDRINTLVGKKDENNRIILENFGRIKYVNVKDILWGDDIYEILGDADFNNSKLTTLGNLKSIGGNAYFYNSKLESLGNLESIGGYAYFENSKLETLGNLKSIGGYADFRYSNLTSLGNLESIGGYAYFENSNLKSLGNLKSIGGNADFRYSNLTSLGNLESIGGYAYFRYSNLTSLGNLKSIGGSVYFENSKLETLGNLKSIGGYADFSYSKLESLGNLESIGGDANFNNSKLTTLGNLKSIGGSVYFGNRTDLEEEWERIKENKNNTIEETENIENNKPIQQDTISETEENEIIEPIEIEDENIEPIENIKQIQNKLKSFVYLKNKREFTVKILDTYSTYDFEPYYVLIQVNDKKYWYKFENKEDWDWFYNQHIRYDKKLKHNVFRNKGNFLAQLKSRLVGEDNAVHSI